MPVADADGLGRWFRDQCEAGSLVEYLKTFALTTAVMQTAHGLERVAREFVQDLAADGVIYGEIRWAPEQHVERGLSLDEAVEAVQRGIEAGIDDAAADGRVIRAGQLVSAMRQNDRGREIAELALRHRDRGAVGFDIAGPEAGFPAGRLREAFDLLAASFFPRTVHAGEADGIESIRGALLDGRALRLGHGVRIAEDIELSDGADGRRLARLGEVATWVRDREITLELSPSSNVQTAAFAQWGTELAEVQALLQTAADEVAAADLAIEAARARAWQKRARPRPAGPGSRPLNCQRRPTRPAGRAGPGRPGSRCPLERPTSVRHAE